MVPKKLLSSPSNTVSFLFILSLLGSTFATPSWAMDEGVQQAPLPCKKPASFFDCDFEHLKAAKQVVKQATFLPKNILLWFEISARTCNREQFLDPQKRKSVLEEQIRKKRGENLTKGILQIFVETLKPLYEPYFNNIQNDIDEKGPRNYALFDAFFYMLLEIQAREAAHNLLRQLEEVKFLKNFKRESLGNINESYSPSAQLQLFHQNNKAEDITTMIIAGGHVGPRGMESISRYNKAITIDLSPGQCPNVIADINDSELLQGLALHKKGKGYKIICDSSDMKGFSKFNELMSPKTHALLVTLLETGGRIIIQRAIDPKPVPFHEDMIEYWVTDYNFIPIPDSKSRIIALEKRY